MCTKYVWIYPLIHRDRCLYQFTQSEFASSIVVESTIAVVYPRFTNRIPKSQSSVTLNASQPESSRNCSALKWFDVPPKGIGALTDCNPGNTKSNHNEYSAVKIRVNKFWCGL